MTMRAATMSAGARYYGALTLPLYDLLVLKTVVPYAWGCPLAKEQALYNRLVGAKHLDVGVASGYFLHQTKWPVETPEITLMDLNKNSTVYAANRLREAKSFSVTELTGDTLQPFPTKDKFDSVGLFHLLHCIPGDLKEKSVVLENAANVLKPGGVVFGANVTPVEGTPNLFAKSILAFSHALGALNNQKDSHADMEEILSHSFDEYKLERVGCMTLCEARSPKSKKE